MSTAIMSPSLPAVHWIGGEWVDAGKHHDPATGDVLGQYADAGRAEIEAGSLSMVTRPLGRRRRHRAVELPGRAGSAFPGSRPRGRGDRRGHAADTDSPGQRADQPDHLGTPEPPVGVVNVITGGREAGDVLVRSLDVPVISFTGSSNTGRTISANAAPGLKRLRFELGGKTPMIVFDDADLDAALPTIVTALVLFAGQFCMTGSRVLVQRGFAEQVLEGLTRRIGSITVGPASDPNSEIGPVIDRANADRVDRMVEQAIDAGAEVLLRGGLFTSGPLSGWGFLAPTMLELQDSSLPIVQNEVFGPVLTLQVSNTEAQAVALANDSEYGLSASVWSRDIDRQLRVAHELESGTVWINAWATLDDQFEEGGFRASGQGCMRGLAVMDDFLEYEHISLQPKTIKEPAS